MSNFNIQALTLEMADELDHYRQCLMDDSSLSHPLANRARAELAAEPRQGEPSDEDVEGWADLAGYIKGSGDHPCGFWVNTDDLGPIVRAALARYGTHPAPVPVAERLPGKGDCDASGWCWMWEPGGCWWQVLIDAPFAFQSHTHWLPHWVLPLPNNPSENQK